MKINKKRLETFRKQHGREIFCAKSKTYDIVIAQFLIEQDDRYPELVDVETLAAACGFDFRPTEEENGYLFFRNAVINHEHSLKELNLEKPLIFADDGELIDGHHRLYRAFMLGRETLQAYTLTPAEASLC